MPHSQVDEQVVKMSFDNSNFDGNINDSIKALNSLDQRLSIFDNKEHLNNINTSFSNLANTFSIKGQVMLGVLSSLGKDIYNLGKKAWGALTKGMRDGMGEYNTIIESTEAIYQNVKQNGNSLQDVNNALDELNDYADKTIYNFGQMTRMIGMFSSAGVGLKSSVSTIKGLANSAALVGANMQKAQMAWNAVSRAMSSGRFTNVTWRSLELSGIAGKQFNKVITEVARTMKVKGKQTGKDIDGMIKKWGSLRESLREGWLTKDVFTEAMDIMSGALDEADLKRKGYTKKQISELREIANAAEEAATRVKTFKQLMDTIGEAIGSGWAQSFRILLGDLEDAKKLYTRISNVISDFIDNNANIRNELFKQIVSGKDKGVDGKWKSGQDNFRQIIENMLAIVKTFLKSVKTGFYNIFPVDRIAAAARKVLSVVEKFTRAFVLNTGKIQKDGQELWDTSDIEKVTDAIKDLIRFFRGLASAVDIAWMAISQPIKSIIKRIPFFNDFFGNTNKGLVGIIKKLGQFGDKITVFRDAAKDWQIFGYVMDYFLDNIDELGKKYPVLGAILWVFDGLKKTIKNLKEYFKELNIKPMSAAFGLFKMVVTSLWNVLNAIFGALRNAKNNIDWSWLEGPKKVILNTLKALSDYGRGLLNFEQVTKKIGGVLGTFLTKLGNIFNKSNVVGKVKTATYEMDKSYTNLSEKLDTTGKKVNSIWEKIKGFLTPITDFFKTIKSNGDLTLEGIAKKFALIGGGAAVAALSISHLVKSIKKINIMNNISDFLNSGIDVLKAYQKQAQSKTILNIAIAVGILAAAMIALSFVPYNQLEDGLTIFIAFITTLSIALATVVNSLTRFNEVLGKSRKELTQFDVLNNLTTQLGQIGMKLAKGFNKQSLGKMFKDIAISIFILVGALSALVLLFKFDKDNTVIAIYALSGIIGVLAVSVGVLVAAMNAFSKTATNFAGTFSQFAKLAGVSGIIVSMSLAVLVLVGAMAALSKIEADRLQSSFAIIIGLITMLGVISVAITGIASNASSFDKLKKVSVRITGAIIAVVAIAAAFALLVKYIGQDQSDSWAAALTAIIAVMGVFGIIATTMIAAASNIQDAKVFKKLGSLVAVMTVSVLAIAAGLYALSKAGSIPASIVVTIGIISAATVALLVFMAHITSKAKSDFSTNFVKIVEGIAFAISAIVVSFGVLTAAVAALIMSINAVDISNSDSDKATSNIVEKIGRIAEILNKALPELKKLFYSLGNSFGTIFTSFATGFIDMVMSVGDAYKDIADKFVNLVIDIVKKVVTTLKSRKEDIAAIITDLVDFLGTEIATAINAFFSKNGDPVVSSDQVLKWIGGLGIATVLGKYVVPNIIKTISNYNTLITGLNNSKKNIKDVSKAFNELKFQLEYNVELAKEGQGIFASFSKTGGVFSSTAGNVCASLGAIALAVAAITTAVIALRGAWKRWTGEVQDSYKMEDLFSMKGLEQVLVDGFEKLGRIMIQFGLTLARGLLGIVSWLAAQATKLLTQPIAGWADLLYQTFGWDWAKGISDNLGNVVKGLEDTASNSFGSIVTGWKNVWNENAENADIGLSFFDKNLEKNVKEASKKAYEGSKEITENYKQGAVDGLAGMEDALVDAQSKANAGLIAGAKVDLDEHSPSKKSYNIYWNYILGAKNALSNGGKELVNVMNSNNKKLIKETITGSKTIEDAYKKVGVELDTRKGLNTYEGIKYTEYGSGEEKEVSFHKALTEEILKQKDALLGLSEQQARIYIDNLAYHQAQELGLNDEDARLEETQKIVDYLFGVQRDKEQILWSSIQSLEAATTRSWSEVLSTEEEASMMALEQQLKTNSLLVDVAEDKKKQLVGKSKSQAQEIIKNELKYRGMSEEQAEEESKKMVALMFSKQKQQKKLEASSLEKSVAIMKAEVDAYEASQKEITAALEKELDKRAKMEANAADWQHKAETGQVNSSNYKEYIQSKKDLEQQNAKVNNLKAQLDAIVKNTTAKMAQDGTLSSKQFEADYEAAIKQLGINGKKSKTSIADGLKNFWKDVTSRLPSDPKLNTWNFNTGKNKNNLKDDKNKAVNEAKDLKKDLEKNRADLTPTFDLDKLASDANKANGIVMSSLSAAQNAAIGDYINKDSELNPFMKDRWQNVYNFTQNNYSPKALSRIDIYRQTQRQLSMSRGF
jgi:hypothetical protein